jgi:hypothetical protein
MRSIDGSGSVGLRACNSLVIEGLFLEDVRVFKLKKVTKKSLFKEIFLC